MPHVKDPSQTQSRILSAAMNRFAEGGFDGSTLRDIASDSHVSLGLIRHHFGSKEQLRDACTDLALVAVRNAESQAQLNSDQLSDMPAGLQRYIARTVLEDSAGGRKLFDEMFAASVRFSNSPDSSSLPLLLTVMTLGIPLLENQLTRLLGTPALEGEGLRTVRLALLELFTTTQIDG